MAMASPKLDDVAFNPGRRLCPDGACLGVISEGRCALCGAAAEGGESGVGAATNGSPTPSAEQSYDDPLAPDLLDSLEGGVAAVAPFDPTRRLCSDDACIGIIGRDDCCSLCGKPGG